MSTPLPSDTTLGQRVLAHLERVVAQDSASDEHSQSVPTTPGQVALADDLAGYFKALHAEVSRDDFGNVIARFAGRGQGAQRPPVALMVHLDTAPGTAAVPKLRIFEGWQGQPVPYPANPGLQVSLESYPSLRDFVGHDLVFGPGDRPFGLDDKLGLSLLMGLAELLQSEPPPHHPPLWIIGRPDEEVGRVEALLSVADALAAAGVRSAYTVDGIMPFEINVENFNAAGATVHFPLAQFAQGAAQERLGWTQKAPRLRLFLGGVNTHGATAKPEGHRPATRFAVEILARLRAQGFDATQIAATYFCSVPARDCDGEWVLALRGEQQAQLERAVREAAQAVVGPHLSKGASLRIEAQVGGSPEVGAGAAGAAGSPEGGADAAGSPEGGADAAGSPEGGAAAGSPEGGADAAGSPEGGADAADAALAADSPEGGAAADSPEGGAAAGSPEGGAAAGSPEDGAGTADAAGSPEGGADAAGSPEDGAAAGSPEDGAGTADAALAAALQYIEAFLHNGAAHGVQPVAAEDSEGREGYSQPYRLRPAQGEEAEGWVLHVRLRDFDAEGLERRKAHVRATAPEGAGVQVSDQYVNMAPRLAEHPHLARWAEEAAQRAGVPVHHLPIRGGTGVDPFLDRGVPVANLGTGYFAPESEKELTSVQMMGAHLRWLYTLCAVMAET